MRERLIAVRERRAALVTQAATERDELAFWLARSDTASRWIGRGAEFLRGLPRHPLGIALAVALVVVLRPARVLRWAVSAWSIWRLALRARGLWRLVAPVLISPARARRARPLSAPQ